MPELLFGLLVGVVVGSQWDWSPTGILALGGAIAVALYLGSCWLFPYRRCPLCGSDERVHDNDGNYRRRWFACWWCRGAKHNRRIGSRLMGLRQW